MEIIRSDERVMLTYAWDGVPLLPEHGFPLKDRAETGSNNAARKVHRKKRIS
jgi:hypothetical protein